MTTCPECATDPKCAPKRYCPRGRCYCGHASCPSVGYYIPRHRNVYPLLTGEPIAAQADTTAESAQNGPSRETMKRPRVASTNSRPEPNPKPLSHADWTY